MIDLSLLQDFITEANEHLEEMETSLLRLEKEPDNQAIMNDIFRAIHTIKGASQFVGLDRISELSHKMENLLDLLRQGEKRVNQEIIDTLIDTQDRLAKLTRELEVSQEEESSIDDLLDRILALSNTDETSDNGGSVMEDPADDPIDESTAETDEDKATEDTDLESALEAALDTSILDDDLGGVDTSILGDDLDTSILDGFSSEEEADHTDEEDLFASDPAETFNDEPILRELGGEENDEELFDIFLKQTRDNLEKLSLLTEQLDDREAAEEALDKSKACLENLRSSANYMGYINLVGLYNLWAAELDDAIKGLEEGGEESFDFMKDFLDRINRVIPRPAGEDSAISIDSAGKESQARTAGEYIPDLDTEAIRSEISEELYDDELFEIFIKQVAENLGTMNRALSESQKTGETGALIKQCHDSLAKLKSSANYMGYANLVDFYEKWGAGLDKAEGGEVPALVGQRLELMTELFPNLPETDRQEESLPFGDDLSERVAEEKAAQKVRDEEDELFMTLSDSIDNAMTGLDQQSVGPLHGILEEMLFAEDPEETHLAAPADEKGQTKGTGAGKESTLPEPAKPVSEKKITVDASTPPAEEEHRHQERRQTERRQKERREGGERTYKQSIRVDSEKIDSLMNQVGELVVSRAYFAQIFNYLKDLQQQLKEESGFDAKGLKPIRELTFKLSEATVGLGRVSNELQEGVMKIRMLPVAQLFNRYPRLVRDLIHKTGKKVELVVRGEETELDKMVIEEISDPLIHIIRNAVDHGLESPEERKKAGKPETGTLILEAYHESNHIVIEITDDGRGIDIEKVKQKALARGLISSQELSRISDAEARRFIMMPGFSTADTPTETSGRGVGMDVIKTNIEKLNGTVEVDSQPGVQTMIRIKIPLTLAIIQALMVRVGDELFTIPLSVVEETLRIFEHETSTIEGVEVIHLRDTTMPIFRLADIFRIEGARREISQSFVVVVTTGMQEIGLVVDELIGQEEVVIKPLVDYLREESGFSGATIIGDGRISLILDIYELVKMTSEKQIERTRQQALSRNGKTKVIKSGNGKDKKASAKANASGIIH